MSRLSRLFDKSSRTQPVTSEKSGNSAWTQVGNAADHLLAELESLYWTGVNEELDCIVSTLRQWQQPQFQHIHSDENDRLVSGFDTFIANVIPQSSPTAPQLASQISPSTTEAKVRLVRSAQIRAMELAAAKARTKVNLAVHKRLAQRPIETDTAKRRARLLLQAAGFLDIEKTIEHSPASGTPSPLTPQLRMTKKGLRGCPIPSVLPCSECKQVIRGNMFEASGRSTQTICEDCYWEHHYGDASYTKKHKHSIADEVVARVGRHARCRACRRRHTENSRPYMLGSRREMQILADAKYLGVQEARKRTGLSNAPIPLAKVIQEDYNRRSAKYDAAWRSGDMRLVGDEWLCQDFVQENPWKNIRVAVRVGPLVFENGTKESRNGAGITLRDPIFGQGQQKADRISLAVCGELERQLWRQPGIRPQKLKRFQAILKQVVGTPFTGWPLSTAEHEIIELLVKASSDSAYGTRSELQDKVKTFLSPWVSVYLRSIAGKLLDSKTTLAWDASTNNCQQFCDSLLDWQVFGPLLSEASILSSEKDPPQALYRVSFLCRPGATQNPFSHPTTISDVPYGLTEEYIRRFHFGCYTGPDLIDSLHEYWFDWAGFKQHLYPHQNFFPWDCTEALYRYPVKCGDCTLSKHLWAFPFDSWSIIALHLSRNALAYPPSESNPPSEVTWMQNRLTLLTALDTLCAGATAMSNDPHFRAATKWLHLQSDPATDRIKLGGINRAQPYSHALEHRTHDEFFVAKWISNTRQSRAQGYETLREKLHMPRTGQERDRVFWGLEGCAPPRSCAVSPVEDWNAPNANFVVSVTASSSCGACGTQAIAAACAANCGASCGSGGGGGC
ncbi:uncharacterized protein CDV56_101398 [Aspergillus thermomutatus]|uniref:ZZ-type domain-containing protein n=1 Tax=Aspergillus thermomutatus TaxID=41047 RepID=A0A397G3C9_ASPTH|nr:uncharacterized protein CDV56_101398 [Aspergillus thermomutatus]RHZ43373.1 hypothetical protein CDV56_101398 [Aspergillus thermomutatus]